MAEERAFLIAVDATDPRLNIAELRYPLTGDARITSWWNYLPGVFLITAPLEVDEVTDLVRVHTGGTTVLVIEVNPARADGWLPERAWQWLRRRGQPRPIPPGET